MKCSNCGSDNTQRLEVIFEDGTSNINTKSKTAGTNILNPLGGMFAAKTTTKGISMTSAARKAAPPAKKTFKPAVILSIIAFILFAIATDGNNNSFIGILASIVIIAIAIFLGIKAFKYNKEVFPELYNRWLRQWMCNKCGTIFESHN